AYTYDLRELVKTVSVGKTATDTDPKVTSYTYTDRGQKLKETKANDNTVDFAYYFDGALKSTVEKKADGTTLVASRTYAYDPNGNKAQDVAKKMNADNHTAYLDSTTDYSYDPANRLTKSVKTGNGAGTETYVHDDNANVISQTVKGTSTTYHYDRNRLLTATTSGVTADYNYDPFGRQQSVTSQGKVISRSVYDGFDHVVESQKMDDTGAMKSTTYTFDPLDRTASKTADGKTTDFTYLGLSGEVLNEEVAGELTKSYQYSPWGKRLSQVKHNTDGTAEDGYYSYNSHSDVETLTDDNGDTKATYGYTAYGANDESEFTGIDKPDTTDATKEDYNPYRYNSKRWDAQSGTYDMGFRDYNPGLNRFTTRDMYNGALADVSLGNDPYTGNRYAFTGGNPISRIELDGHDWCDWCSDTLDATGDWFSENSDTLQDIGWDLLETGAGAGGTVLGVAAVVVGAGECVVGGIPTLGASCALGAATATAGGALAMESAGVFGSGLQNLFDDIANLRSADSGSSGGFSASSGEIAYNSDDLSRAAFNARVKSGVGDGRNVAAAWVEGLDAPVIGFSKGKVNGKEYHSEDDILAQLTAMKIDPSKIRALYSERQPCPDKCDPMLAKTLENGTPVSWSVPWHTKTTELGLLMNQQSNEMLSEMIRRAKGY
ncbi:nucleic acid/nucleotide deaminase domain-containing protein, partial [Streptomyces cellulosae]